MFEGFCETTGEKVAIKKTGVNEETFERECQVLSSLSHPNIIKFRDCFFNKSSHLGEGVICNIVTDYYDADLKHLLVTFKHVGQEMPRLLKKVYSYQMIKALVYLEAKAIIHGDICLENFLINYKTQIVSLCDFGSASKGNERNQKSSNQGYQAPEQLLDQGVTSIKADIWALGCSIAYLHTNKTLFAQNSGKEQLETIFSIVGFPSRRVLMKDYGIVLDKIDRIKPIGLNKVLLI